MDNAKEYFGTEFVKEMYKLFGEAEQEDKFLFMHGANSLEEANNIASNGLECDYPELLYTAELMNKNDNLLFDKLKSWPHWNLKYLLMICVPKSSGKGGIPIWNENSEGFFVLSPQLIRGIIDVNKKQIIENSKYNSSKNIDATYEDRSYETETGKCIGISLPPDELELYENGFEFEKND